MSMVLLFPICVLYISLMQLVNEEQFLFIFFLLFAAALASAVFETVMFALARIYASL